MKKAPLTLADIKNKIDELVGREVAMQVCRGRKQVKNYTGVVENAFKSVFVVRLTSGSDVVSQLSYSYSDVLCGEVVLVPRQHIEVN